MTSKSDQIRALRERQWAEQQALTRAVNNKKSVNNAVNVSPPVINKSQSQADGNAERQRKWRASNTALNQQRAREGMRKRRAAQKDST